MKKLKRALEVVGDGEARKKQIICIKLYNFYTKMNPNDSLRN